MSNIDPINEAKPHIKAGFDVLLLKKRSKAPHNAGWSEAPVATLEELENDYRKGMNLGVRLGKPSRVDGKYLHVIDLDIREGKYAKEAWKALKRLFPGVDLDELPIVKTGSGGESRHRQTGRLPTFRAS